MSIFAGMNTEGLEQVEDVVGGGSYRLTSNIYTGFIKAVYISKSKKGGMSANLLFTPEGSDVEYRESFYIANEKGQNFYEKDGKKFPYAGFTIIDDLCTIATGKPLSQQDSEDKVFKLYDFDLKQEVPTTVPVISGLLGVNATLVIREFQTFKQVQDGGNYVDSDEIITKNETLKALYSDGSTVSEKATNTAPVYATAWLEKWKDSVYDKTKGKTPKATKQTSGGNAPERKSLFEKKS